MFDATSSFFVPVCLMLQRSSSVCDGSSGVEWVGPRRREIYASFRLPANDYASHFLLTNKKPAKSEKPAVNKQGSSATQPVSFPSLELTNQGIVRI